MSKLFDIIKSSADELGIGCMVQSGLDYYYITAKAVLRTTSKYEFKPKATLLIKDIRNLQRMFTGCSSVDVTAYKDFLSEASSCLIPVKGSLHIGTFDNIDHARTAYVVPMQEMSDICNVYSMRTSTKECGDRVQFCTIKDPGNRCRTFFIVTENGEQLIFAANRREQISGLTLEIDNEKYMLTAWDTSNKCYKQIIKETDMATQMPSLESLIEAHPAMKEEAKKRKAAMEADVIKDPMKDDPPFEVPKQAAPTEPPVANVAEEAEPVDATEEKEAPKKRTRMRRAVVVESFDFKDALEYLQQPIPEDMTLDKANAEIKIIRDLSMCAVRRIANLSEHLTKQIEPLVGLRDKLAALKKDLDLTVL